MRGMHSINIFLLSICIATCSVADAREVSEDMRKACLSAADYEGCIRSYLNPPSAIEENDFLGMPKLKGWKRAESSQTKTIVYFNTRSAAKVMVRGTFGRYISHEYLIRWYEPATADIPGYIDYSGSMGRWVPGIPGRPGTVMQGEIKLAIIDCLDRKVQWAGYDDWLSIDGKYLAADVSQPIADQWCSRIEYLPQSSIRKYAAGSPKSKDILATKILPGSDPEAIKKNYGSR